MGAFKLMLFVAGLSVLISLLVAGVIQLIFNAIRRLRPPAPAASEPGKGS